MGLVLRYRPANRLRPTAERDEEITTLHEAVRRGGRLAVKRLAGRGGLDARDALGRTALQIAARKGCLGSARQLLAAGADADAHDPAAGDPPALHLAAKHDDPRMARLLLRHGADPLLGGRLGWTALHLGCRYAKPEMVELLLAGGAEPDAPTLDGYTPLKIACLRLNGAVVGALCARGAALGPDPEGATPLHWLALGPAHPFALLSRDRARLERRRVAETLLRRGAGPDRPDPAGRTALGCALLAPDPAARPDGLAAALLDWGADVDAPQTAGGFTLLHVAVAARWRGPDLPQALLRLGARPNRASADGSTALHLACRSGHLDAVELLLRYGAEPGLRNARGLTALEEVAGEEARRAVRRAIDRANRSVAFASWYFGESAAAGSRFTGDEYTQWRRQLDAMKVTRVGGSKLAYHEVVSAEPSEILDRPNGRRLVKLLAETSEYEKKFPEYCGLVHARISRIVRLMLIRDVCDTRVASLLGERLPRAVVRKVFSHLDNCHLKYILKQDPGDSDK